MTMVMVMRMIVLSVFVVVVAHKPALLSLFANIPLKPSLTNPRCKAFLKA